jgi:hypothetical protein
MMTPDDVRTYLLSKPGVEDSADPPKQDPEVEDVDFWLDVYDDSRRTVGWIAVSTSTGHAVFQSQVRNEYAFETPRANIAYELQNEVYRALGLDNRKDVFYDNANIIANPAKRALDSGMRCLRTYDRLMHGLTDDLEAITKRSVGRARSTNSG